MSKKCFMCDSEKVVFRFDEKYFCSEECLEEYIKENANYEVAKSELSSMACGYCGNEITSCDECGRYFDIDDEVICCDGYHFCSIDCLFEYYKEDVEDLIEKVKKEL